MIIETHSDREYNATLTMLRVINVLRDRGADYTPPEMADAPWVKTQWPKPQYL